MSSSGLGGGGQRPMRIRPEVREQHCKTLRLALHVWLDQYPEDFKEPPNYPCLNQLEAFTQRIMPGSELDEKVEYVHTNSTYALPGHRFRYTGKNDH